MAYLLHIDTSGSKGMVALSENGQPLARKVNSESRDHAASLNLMMEEVCREGGIGLQQLDAVVVCGGPGSYTGLRIGLAAAKGLCYALDLPLILHNKLALIAWHYEQEHPNNVETIVVLSRARDHEYFFAAFTPGFVPLLEPQHADEINTNKSISNTKGHPVLIYTENTDYQFFDISFSETVSVGEEPDINSWSLLSYRDYQSRHYANIAHAEPFYLKSVYINK